MWRLAVMLALSSGAAVGEEGFSPMSGEQIRAALTDGRLVYEGGWQEFRASGRTLYHVGGDSWGYWAVRGDRYCSQWPPSDRWDCYDMAREGDVLRFFDDFGNVTDGRLE